MSGVTKYCISIEISLILKGPFMHALHIMAVSNKAHMTCVGQTNPHILRSKVLSPISKAEAKVAMFCVDQVNFHLLVTFNFIT